MRVCMVASSYPRFPGDIAGTFIHALAEGLTDGGHSVGIVAPDDPAVVPGDARSTIPVRHFPYAPFGSWHFMGYGKALEDDQRLHPLTYGLAAPFAVSGMIATSRAVSDWRSEVIHAHWVLPNGPLAAVAARATGKPFVVTLHGSDLYLALLNPALGWIASRTLRAAQIVTACSPDLLDGALHLGAREESLRLIPWGGDTRRFGCSEPSAYRQKLGIEPGTQVVLGVGRMVAKKGFSYLLDAFAEIPDKCQSVLVFAGDGPQRVLLEQQAGSLGLAECVRFAGHVPSASMPDLMAAADVVVVPSVRDERGNQDGLPTVALEAMAAGKPVVASALGGLPSIIQHGQTGLLVPPGDSRDLAKALSTLLASPETACTYGRAGRARTETDLSWRAIADRYAGVYREAMSG